tara:strand:- start:409 stop:543 length:135 start_codon:yes stop_codon:yes gene_type:complete
MKRLAKAEMNAFSFSNNLPSAMDVAAFIRIFIARKAGGYIWVPN